MKNFPSNVGFVALEGASHGIQRHVGLRRDLRTEVAQLLAHAATSLSSSSIDRPVQREIRRRFWAVGVVLPDTQSETVGCETPSALAMVACAIWLASR